MAHTLRRIAPTAMILILVACFIAGYFGLYVPYVTRMQLQRADFERYLNRAVEVCQNGNGMAAYGLLVRAQSVAPSTPDEQYVRDLFPRFRVGDCRLTLSTSADGSDVEVH